MPDDNIDRVMKKFLGEVADQETDRDLSDPTGAREIVYQWDFIYDTVGPPEWIEVIVPVVMIDVHRNPDGTPNHDWLCTVSYNGEDFEDVPYTAWTHPKPGDLCLMRRTANRDGEFVRNWVKIPEEEEERWLYYEGGIAVGDDTHFIAYRGKWPPKPGEVEDEFVWEEWETVNTDYVGNVFDSNNHPEKGIQMVTRTGGDLPRHIPDVLHYYQDWGRGDILATYTVPLHQYVQNCSNFGLGVVTGETTRKDVTTHSEHKRLQFHETNAILCHWPGNPDEGLLPYDQLCWQNGTYEIVTDILTRTDNILDAYNSYVSHAVDISLELADHISPIIVPSEPPPGWVPPDIAQYAIWTTCNTCYCFALGGTWCNDPVNHTLEVHNIGQWEGTQMLLLGTSIGRAQGFVFQPLGPESPTFLSPVLKVWPWLYPLASQIRFEPVPYTFSLHMGEDALANVTVPPPYPTFRPQTGAGVPDIPVFQIGYDTVTDKDHPRLIIYSSWLSDFGPGRTSRRLYLLDTGSPEGGWVDMIPRNITHISKDGRAAIGNTPGDPIQHFWTDNFGVNWYSLPAPGESTTDYPPAYRCFIFAEPTPEQ